MKIFLLLNLFLFVLLFEQIFAFINFIKIEENLVETAQNRSRRYLDSTEDLYCGTKDFTLSHGSNGKWLKNSLTYYIGSNSSSMPTNETKDGIRAAFNRWSEIVPLTFTEIDDERADIWIGFRKGEHGDDLPFDGSGKQIAHCLGQMPCTVIHFDDAENWRYVEMGRWLYHQQVDFLSVAMHQIGHALGLGHYDGYANNIMNSKYLRPASKSEVYIWPNLKPDEIKAVKDLYGISTAYSYVGCFINRNHHLHKWPFLNEKQYEFDEENSVNYCVQICSRDDYRYAGIFHF
uniref:Peptidase metallopeptidase domain-containing protein n=1 Tax=Acrobeloides nanus TaxID=290746 RepID=A0A914E6E8_9BILA